MSKFIIVGAGGLGREIYAWLTQDLAHRGVGEITGFIDDNQDVLKGFPYPVPLLGSINDYQPGFEDQLVVSLGDPVVRRDVVASLVGKGARFYSLVHPSAIVGQNVKLGTGSIICPNCILTSDISIGDFVFINTSSTIGHDVTIGDYTTVNGKVEITGKVTVGSGCSFGVGAKVIPGRRIGNGSVIGAGSVVIRHVKAGTSVFGNPARGLVRPGKDS